MHGLMTLPALVWIKTNTSIDYSVYVLLRYRKCSSMECALAVVWKQSSCLSLDFWGSWLTSASHCGDFIAGYLYLTVLASTAAAVLCFKRVTQLWLAFSQITKQCCIDDSVKPTRIWSPKIIRDAGVSKRVAWLSIETIMEGIEGKGQCIPLPSWLGGSRSVTSRYVGQSRSWS